MSQSSETTTHSDFDMFGYPNHGYSNGYYTAQPRPGIGICIASMSGGTMVQFFPWALQPDIHRDDNMVASGHAQYAAFITAKVTADAAENGELFQKWPFIHCDTTELLIIKCVVEEGLKEVEKHNETVPGGGVNAPAGEALE
jgi:hypothetical protein